MLPACSYMLPLDLLDGLGQMGLAAERCYQHIAWFGPVYNDQYSWWCQENVSSTRVLGGIKGYFSCGMDMVMSIMLNCMPNQVMTLTIWDVLCSTSLRPKNAPEQDEVVLWALPWPLPEIIYVVQGTHHPP